MTLFKFDVFIFEGMCVCATKQVYRCVYTLALTLLDRSRTQLNFDGFVDDVKGAVKNNVFLSSINGVVDADARCEWTLSELSQRSSLIPLCMMAKTLSQQFKSLPFGCYKTTKR